MMLHGIVTLLTSCTDITWIIIILIIVSIIVTCLEAFIRFYMRVGAVQRASILADKLETFVSPEGI